MTFKSLLDHFRKPSAEVIAQHELEDAHRDLLSAQAGKEYATAMVEYHQARIARLTDMLRGRQA
jgi:hypothetical protein